ncbi:YigZ family protein [Castellaniella sp. GW247-6E4]|uniref:IMPACT family protein n=1 Tax=Castellaniella sp. GW247-6E4 TaxID=3140380 RepID=UPI0033164808
MAFLLGGVARYEEDIRKSRFLAVAAPAHSADEAAAFLETARQPQATHNCWAWRIGQAYRFHDDGEPGGTAGRPILQAIEGQDCDRVVVMVTRWFGGIKLGTGGLVRAYGGVVAQCLRLADKAPWVEERRVRCDCAFGDLDRVRARLSEAGARIEDEAYGLDGVTWTLAIEATRCADLETLYMNLTRGRGVWTLLDGDSRG